MLPHITHNKLDPEEDDMNESYKVCLDDEQCGSIEEFMKAYGYNNFTFQIWNFLMGWDYASE